MNFYELINSLIHQPTVAGQRGRIAVCVCTDCAVGVLMEKAGKHRPNTKTHKPTNNGLTQRAAPSPRNAAPQKWCEDTSILHIANVWFNHIHSDTKVSRGPYKVVLECSLKPGDKTFFCFSFV